ncbi:hypothetical protein QYE76_001942 [Lolium multiflorum]|uniref:Aminotransferase-like plant mobile domain-containing protein n=1 Tax=Lolium multiflorum TaxID=4521 RepID=A0AAD8RNS7_LOLMU|nr:hypothetical protein QYE76_001942 [Lolium multiflorum]
MSTVEEVLVEESTTQIISGGDPSRPVARSAHFLLPRGDSARPPALPLPPSSDVGPVLADELKVELSGWPGTSKQWRRWVAKLRPRHELLWREVGILPAVLATTSWVRRDEGLLLQLAPFWSGDTSTFVFPWGEATVTLQDVAVLGGLPLLGHSVGSRSDELRRDVDALEAVRILLIRTKCRKAGYAAWVKHFADQPTGDDTTLLEHGAFLAMWLSRYVFPAPPFDVVRPEVFPIAARLARGKCVALAPAALASVYKDLSALNRYLSSGNTHRRRFVGCAPLHILQLWVWERFPELRPETKSASRRDDPGAPRAAHWHNVKRALHPSFIHSVFMSPDEFQWRPYKGTSFPLLQGKAGCWVHGQDIAECKELLSFAQCLRPCELVSMGCIQQYCPHRVARQLGFDQDVPRTVARAKSSRKAAWATYKMQPENITFFIPQCDPGVTVAYSQWWEPYLSTRASAVANAARMKQIHVEVSPRKRKAQDLPRVDSCKERHPKAGMILPDDTEDPQDEVPLAERLNSIILMTHKQDAERHTLKDRETLKENSETPLKDFVPTWTRKGRRKVVSRKVADQDFSDAETVLVTAIDEPSCGSVSKNEHCKEQVSDSVMMHDDNNISSEHGDVEGAVSTGSNKGIGPAIVVDVHPYLQDISDDELDDIFGKDTEVTAMYLKLSRLAVTINNSDQPYEERNVVTVSRDEQEGTKLKDIMAGNNCDYELATVQSDTTLGRGPDGVTRDINVKTNVDVLEASIDEMQTDNVTKEQDQGAKVDTKNSIVLKENYGASSDGLVNGNGELVTRVISTDTLYYVIPFERVKDAKIRDSRATNAVQGVFQPRREVGTKELIREVSEAREAEKVELEAIVDRLKQQLVALEGAGTGRSYKP